MRSPFPRSLAPRMQRALLALLLVLAPVSAGAKSGTVATNARVTAATAADQKMDAPLRLTLERYAEVSAAAHASLRAAPTSGRLFGAGVPFGNLREGPGGEPEVDVFLMLSDADGVAAVTASGGRVVLQDGELAIARMPISRVTDLAEAPAVRSLSLSRELTPALDSSRTRTRVKEVHQGGGALPQAYLGFGVIVGVLDSGLDYTHPDFRHSVGDSRLLALYDFSQGSTPVECSATQLDALLCAQIDGTGGHGHGTHVTGIAAGNARLNPAYMGMAPQADLLFVKGIRDAQSNGGFDESDVIAGVLWMMNKALAAGKPIAVNLSLGSQLGAHDGTSTQEQFLERMAGPGRIIVAAAGNSGGQPIHAGYAVEGSNYDTALETGILMTSPSVVVDMWAPPTTNMSVGVAAYDPGDLGTPLFVSNGVPPGQLAQGTATAINGGQILAQVTIDARTTADPRNGARNVLVAISQVPGQIDPSLLYWSIFTYGGGTFDMWQVSGSFFFPPGFPQGQPVPPWFRSGDDSKTIANPASGRRILCVGSHVSKTSWIDVNDTLRSRPSAILNVRSTFSSRGPSRDGRVLPDFTAPGEAIISALSTNYPADSAFIVQGGGYQEQHGTSQAAPHITGIAALMLQRDPSLTPENIRTILQGTATPAGPGTPNNDFGYGRVNALAALQGTPDPMSCSILLPSGLSIPCDEAAGLPFAMMAYPNPAPGRVSFSVTAPTAGPLDVAVYDLMGRRARTLIRKSVDPGVHFVNWNGQDERGRPLPDGVYFVRLLAPTGQRTLRLVLRH